MKYTIVIAALLGLMSNDEVTAMTRSHVPSHSFVQEQSDSESDSDEEDAQNV